MPKGAGRVRGGQKESQRTLSLWSLLQVTRLVPLETP